MGLIASSYTVSDPALLSLTGWWLKDPLNASMDRAVFVEMDAVEEDSTEDQGIFYPLGEADPIVVAGEIRPGTVSVQFFAVNAEAEDSLNALRFTQRVLLLQSPAGEQWYGRFTGSWRRVRGAGLWRRISTTFQETAPPTVV